MDFTVKNIKNKINKNDTDFEIYKIKYSKKEIDTIKNFNLNTENDTFDHYGDLKSLDIFDFIQSIGENNKEAVSIIEKLIKKICKVTIAGFNKKYFWISIRFSNPNTLFDIPRWHRDGKYFMDSQDEQAKFIITLKGPGTLLIEKNIDAKNILDEHDKTLHNKISNLSVDEKIKIITSDENKKELDEKLNSFNKVQLSNDEALIFYSNSLIHSEPKIDKQRIFISILPGEKTQIETLKNRFNKNQKGGNLDINFKNKYLKYKIKYLKLKNKLNF